MPDEDKKSMVEKLKKELAKLEWEEKLLRKRDDRLKWEEEMLEMEEGLKTKRADFMEKAPPEMLEKKEEAEEPKESHVEPGTTYLLKEQKPDRSNRIFTQQMNAGYKGLYITRSNPKQVRKKYDLGDADVCWLTGVKTDEDIKSVSGLQELSILVSNFIDENSKSVILLDGLEYLISNNDFPIVLRLVQQIRDKVSTSESNMLIPLNPAALDERQVTLLERECGSL